MGAKSSKQDKTLKKESKLDDSEGEAMGTAAMSFDMENVPCETLKSLEIKQEIGNFEDGITSADSESELESRASSGTDSEVSQDEVDDTDDGGDSKPETASEDSISESGDESTSKVTAEDDDPTTQSIINEKPDYEASSIQEVVDNHVALNPDHLPSLRDFVEEVDIVEESGSPITEDKERISCGADVTYHQNEQLHQFEDEQLSENSISSTEYSLNSFENGHQSCPDDPYPVKSETRQNGIILIRATVPLQEMTQNLWRMILEKRVPTIHTSLKDDKSECAPHLPIQGESERKCGVYTIKRLGTESQLSLNLKRQQLLIYEKIGVNLVYKYSVTHFHETKKTYHDPGQAGGNAEVINKHVSHQPNPQLLALESW